MNEAQCTSADTHLGATFGAGPARGTGTFGGFVQRLASLPLTALNTLLVWQERASERHHLGQMDDFMLKDMGLSRADVEKEAALPFWRSS